MTRFAFGQTKTPQVYVFVPGAWDGGWDYQKVDSILTSQGNHVYRPTLTGLGDRVHLADTAINLTTHINDIINLLKYENLHDIILVGHSYGGMVISGVAEQVPDRIKKLIYLDALVPENGESLQTILQPALWEQMMVPKIKDGFVYYALGATSPNPPNDVPQPLKTFTEKIRISNPKVLEIPTCYILMTKDGKAGFFQSAADRAKQRKWKILTFEGGHYSMRDQPEELVKELEEALK
jgi:pimeloyl-ACP methyl ester carboxylesterase